ncbi:hypothetical protein VDGL01_07877 [Verticillium dahliae]
MSFTLLYCLPRLTIQQLSSKFSTPLPPLMLGRRVTVIDDATTTSCRLHLIFMLDVYAQIYNASIFTGLLKRSRRPTAMTRLEADKTRTLHRQATVRWCMKASACISKTNNIRHAWQHRNRRRRYAPAMPAMPARAAAGRAHDVLRLHC